jgi:hypothetical protein
MKIQRSLNLLAILMGLSSLAVAQAQFAGKWQTRISSATGKHSITLNIVVNEDKVGGTLILINPDRSEIESGILNAELRGDTLEFGTKVTQDTFDWRLTLKKGNKKGSLHGSFREMVIDEDVVKQR